MIRVPIRLQRLLPSIVRAAQRVYDEWSQDESGFDEEVGYGGICHLIADEIVGVVADAGVMCTSVSASHEVHVYTVLRLDRSGVWLIDIRPYVYERGGGYNWKKIPGVKFDKSDITVELLDPDPNSFREYTGEYE